MGAMFPGPFTVIMLSIYRIYEACKIKGKTGSFIDKPTSNYWTEVPNEGRSAEGSSLDDFEAAGSNEKEYKLNWTNINLIVTTQALTSLAGLCFVAYAFKFAKLSEMNQGCIPSLFTVNSIYVAILFYFKFNERITLSQIIGIFLMIPCVIFLSLDKKDDQVSKNDLTPEEMKVYGIYAVLFGLCGPIMWTVKTYYIRISID